MCVRVKKWREDAQPEWPKPPSGDEVLSTVGEAAETNRTQSFPATGRNEVLDAGHGGKSPDGFDAFRRGPAAPRDPWAASADPEHTHDPHEVTVQLDGAAPGQETSPRKAEAGPGAPADPSDGPVFVDESGRRGRTFRRLGIAIGIACAVYAVVIVVTLLSGSSDAPWLPVPGQQDDKPAGQVDTSPAPTDPARPAGTHGVTPGTTPAASDGTTPSPGARATASAASADPSASATSAAPTAKPTRSPTKPGTGLGNPSASASTSPPPSGSPDPSPSTGTNSPSAPPSGPAPGTVADGPSTPRPVAQDPAGPAAPPAPTSPENTL
jgi:hypothetical protein